MAQLAPQEEPLSQVLNARALPDLPSSRKSDKLGLPSLISKGSLATQEDPEVSLALVERTE